ncbi:hypothetical protein DBB_23090 [Desulfoluna spongiiphila]|nr:hypothetical protein DBB_23090 [Desulfoluna spongiiphila]
MPGPHSGARSAPNKCRHSGVKANMSDGFVCHRAKWPTTRRVHSVHHDRGPEVTGITQASALCQAFIPVHGVHPTNPGTLGVKANKGVDSVCHRVKWPTARRVHSVHHDQGPEVCGITGASVLCQAVIPVHGVHPTNPGTPVLKPTRASVLFVTVPNGPQPVGCTLCTMVGYRWLSGLPGHPRYAMPSFRCTECTRQTPLFQC